MYRKKKEQDEGASSYLREKYLLQYGMYFSQGTQYIKPTDHYTAAHMTAV